ncbi:hypothetical protein CDD83_9161 [Cordyceps sp. RAO-2017]|nr:hypothetical protein CDD83_9161 [Cordyceps sp. RAO-2017]
MTALSLARRRRHRRRASAPSHEPSVAKIHAARSRREKHDIQRRGHRPSRHCTSTGVGPSPKQESGVGCDSNAAEALERRPSGKPSRLQLRPFGRSALCRSDHGRRESQSLLGRRRCRPESSISVRSTRLAADFKVNPSLALRVLRTSRPSA